MSNRRRSGRARRAAAGARAGVSAAALVALIALAAGCDRGELGIAAVAPPRQMSLTWQLPADSARFAPALTDVPAGLRGASLGDDQSCSTCHAEIYAQQQASAHAWSSFNNPIYRFSVESVRDGVGKSASRMCGGCHDLALLVDGAMDRPVSGDDDRAHTGVTCRICHGIDRARVDGNGSVRLRPTPIPLPRPGDAASIAAHKKAAAPVRVTGNGLPVCGSCHRGFLSAATGNAHVLIGQDELSSWAGSAYSGSGLGRIDRVEKADCIGCHMPRVPAPRGDASAKSGMVSSHRFAGGHTWLAAMLGDAEQLEAHRDMLRGTASIDVAGVKVGDRWHLPADGAPLSPGEAAVFDVVIRNLKVGHRFPGGVLDAQDVFVAVEVTDARGDVIATAGAAHLEGRDDPSAHILRALVAGEDGTLRTARDTHTFRASIINHTIAARDAAVVRYRLQLPAKAALPLEVTARLLHRTRNPTIARLTCAEHRSPRGRVFAAFIDGDGKSLDGCRAPPITEISAASIIVGRSDVPPPQPSPRGGEGEAKPPPEGGRIKVGGRVVGSGSKDSARRLYELGMALRHSVSERLDEARVPLTRALELAADDRTRAAILAQLGGVAGRQGRTDEAIELLGKAEALIGPHPALARIRGEALSRVWRWREAAAALEVATAGAPKNLGGWRALAIAAGSLGDHRGALEAAVSGLAIQPRDPDLLRVQALALEALGAKDAVVERALAAYDRNRPPDRGADIRVECARTVPGCALEREPVHVHDLIPR